MNSGIYAITAPTGAMYVGSAVNLDSRKRSHFSELRRGVHRNVRLQKAFKSHGESLQFRQLIICRKEDLLLYEQIAINALSPGYNICLVAGNSLGVKRSAEYRALKASQQRGKKDSPETRAKKSAAARGRPVSPETRHKLAAQRGWKHTEEAKAKMRGRKKSPEHLAKMSERAKGNRYRAGGVLTESAKARISASLKGRPRSPESIAKQRETNAKKRAIMSTDYEVERK